MRWFMRVVVFVPVLAGTAFAGEPIAMTVSAAAPPASAHRWRLLLSPLEQTEGDSGPVYRECGIALQKAEQDAFSSDNTDLYPSLGQLSNRPITDLDRKQVERILRHFARPLELFETAVRGERVEWRKVVTNAADAEWYLHVGQLLPQLLQLQARLHLLDDRPDLAVRTVSRGLQLARHLHAERCVHSSTHQYHIASAMCGVLRETIAHPRCPDLSGQLAELPRPFFPLRVICESSGEYLLADGRKLSRDPVAARTSPETLDVLIYAFSQTPRDSRLPRFIGPEALKALGRLRLGLAIQAQDAAVRDFLRAAGYDPRVVAATPPLNAAVLRLGLAFEETISRTAAAVDLPYPLARARLDEMVREFVRQTASPDPTGPICPSVLSLPLHLQLHLNDDLWSYQRPIQVLRVEEALRGYAHEKGRWPDKLDDITGSVPLDPATGKPFGYRRDGNKAILEGPPQIPGDPNFPGFTYTLTLR
jgi:hypothetical protein